jgi:uncharacterized protein (TIGR03086 family)
MDQLHAHQRAQQAFQTVLAGVGDEHLELPTPCADWKVSQLVDHVVGGNGWVRQLAAHDPIELPADRPGAALASADGAHAVFASEDGLSRMYDLPFGTVPGMAFVGLRTTDVLVHAWDLAKATGQSTDLDPELAAEALTASQARIAPAFRGEGKPFQAEVACAEDRPTADRLAAFLGRTLD